MCSSDLPQTPHIHTQSVYLNSMHKTPQNCSHADGTRLDQAMARLSRRLPQIMDGHRKLVAGDKDGSMFVCLEVCVWSYQEEANVKAYYAASFDELFEGLDKAEKGLYMNIETLEIYCFVCEIELLDENLTRRFGCKKRPLIDFKEGIMTLIKEYASKVENISILDSNQTMANCGINLLLSSSLANTFSAALYVLWSIEFVRTVGVWSIRY